MHRKFNIVVTAFSYSYIEIKVTVILNGSVAVPFNVVFYRVVVYYRMALNVYAVVYYLASAELLLYWHNKVAVAYNLVLVAFSQYFYAVVFAAYNLCVVQIGNNLKMVEAVVAITLNVRLSLYFYGDIYKVVDYFARMCYNAFVKNDYLFTNLHFFGKGVGKCIELTN
jgi:hypothetical protein